MSQKEVIDKIMPALKEFGVTRAGFFGSFARGDDFGPDSDIDLAVAYDDRSRTLLDTIGFKHQLEELLERKVDVVPDDTFHPLMEPYIRQDLTYFYGQE